MLLLVWHAVSSLVSKTMNEHPGADHAWQKLAHRHLWSAHTLAIHDLNRLDDHREAEPSMRILCEPRIGNCMDGSFLRSPIDQKGFFHDKSTADTGLS